MSYCPDCGEDAGNSNYCPDCGAEQPNGGCFIATAAYGTPFAEEINILRYWRDKNLRTNFFGDLFIKFYYKVSPPIANFIGKKDKLRAFVRLCLNPYVKFLKRKYKK